MKRNNKYQEGKLEKRVRIVKDWQAAGRDGVYVEKKHWITMLLI